MNAAAETDSSPITFPPVPESVLNLIRGAHRVVVSGHLNPDGDAANSVLAMGHLLEKLGKEYLLVNDGSFSRPEIRLFESSLAAQIPEDWLSPETLGIAVDCASKDRLGSKGNLFESFTCLIIDHHATSDPFSRNAYIVPKSPSTTLLVYKLFKALDVELDSEAATLIFRGFATDSGFFRFVGKGSSEVFEIVAELVRHGVNPAKEYETLNSGRPFAALKYLSEMIRRTEVLFGGKLLFSHEEAGDKETYGEDARASDELYRELLSLKNAEAVCFLKVSGKVPGGIEAGLRVTEGSDFDAGAFAAAFGGGGHRKAAGFTVAAPYEEVKMRVLAKFGEYFDLQADSSGSPGSSATSNIRRSNKEEQNRTNQTE